MVDILVEILGNTFKSQIKQKEKCLTYKIRTHWTKVDVEADRERVLVKLPKLQISKCFPRNDKEIWIFVEFWIKDQDEKPTFFGLTKYLVDPLFKDRNLSPSLQWLNVLNPIENTKQGMILFKIEVNISDGFQGPDIPKTLFSPRTSSYFNNSPSSLSAEERGISSSAVQTDSFTSESHASQSPVKNHSSEQFKKEEDKLVDEIADLEKQSKRFETSLQTRFTKSEETKYPNVIKFIEKSLKPTNERRLKPVVYDEKSFIPEKSKVQTTRALEKDGDIGNLNDIIKAFNQNRKRLNGIDDQTKQKSNEKEIFPSIEELSREVNKVIASKPPSRRNAAALYNNWDI